jgi:hypothetical protein
MLLLYRLVDTFGTRDPNVEKLATELVQHTAVVGKKNT